MAMYGVGHGGSPLGAPFEGAAEDFFRSISESGTLPIGVEVQEAASAVVCALLGLLDLEQGREVLDALPKVVRDAIGRCPIHEGEVGEKLDKQALLERIGEHFELSSEASEPMTTAVFRALRRELPPRPAEIVERELPTDLRAVWRRRRV
ncbi:MAG TPA: DUF2267 domain-containing protein [Polyangia bacterium]|jgi:hypothetical protein|nr:DUF2267 domain-containing protein [Polyangia bacterium]